MNKTLAAVEPINGFHMQAGLGLWACIFHGIGQDQALTQACRAF